jgi:hypothetical protein
MKIQKYREYIILEGNSQEDYMDQVLRGIKNRIDPVFDEEKVKKLQDFKNANLQLANDPKIDKYSPTSTTLKYRFTDDNNTVYDLIFTVDLKDAINPNPDEDYKTSDIKKVHVQFKKYASESNGGLDLVDRLLDKSYNPEEINPEFLIKLKVDLDEGKTENDEEEFKIETGKETQGQPKAQSQSQGQPKSQGQAHTKPQGQGQAPAEESVEQTPAQGG